MPVSEILRHANPLVTLVETTLNNTLDNPSVAEGMVADDESEMGNLSSDVAPFVSNAEVVLANRYPVGKQAHKLLEDNITVIREAGTKVADPARSSFGAITILNTNRSDAYSLRSWEDRAFTLKLGGVLYPNTANEQTLSYGDYETWITGRWGTRSVDTDSITLGADPIDGTMYKPFPINLNEFTEDNNDVLPFRIGAPKAARAAPIGDGVFVYHDGNTSTNSHIVSDPLDFFSFSEDHEYLGRGIETTANYGGFSGLIDSSTFEWRDQNDNSVWDSGDGSVIRVSDGFTITSADGDVVTVAPTQDNKYLTTYTRPNYTWQRVDTQNITTSTNPRVDVATTNDVEIVALHTDPDVQEPFRASWFKIAANGTGTVTLNFAEKLSYLELVVRAVRDPNQSISNWSTTPSSITPEFPVTNTENHVVVFDNFGKDTISFDYTANTTALLSAIFVQKAIVAEQQICTVTVETTNDLIDPVFDFVFNDTQSITSNLSTPTVIDKDNGTATFNVTTQSLSLPVQYGYGTFTLELTGGGYGNTPTYGVVSNGKNGYFLKPAPASYAGIFSDMKPLVLEYLDNVTSRYFSSMWVDVTITANIQGGATTNEINAAFSYGSTGLIREFVRLSDEPRTFTFRAVVNDATHLSVPEGIGFFTWQGSQSGKGYSLTNPTEDFTVEVSVCSVIPALDGGEAPNDVDNYGTVSTNVLTTDAQVVVYDEGQRVELPAVYVSDAKVYRGVLPEGFAVLDRKGIVVTSPKYKEVFVTAIGETDVVVTGLGFGSTAFGINAIDAARTLSVITTGEDLITSTVTDSPYIDYPFTLQKPLIEQLREFLEPLDYFVLPDLEGNGVQIIERYDYTRYPDDFTLTEDDFIANSLTRIGSEPREQQYIVKYDLDYADDKLSKVESSKIVSLSDRDAKVLRIAANTKAAAERVANRASRDGSPNGVYRGILKHIQSDLQVGMAGTIKHPDIPPSRPCIIKSIEENTGNREPIITFKVLEKR